MKSVWLPSLLAVQITVVLLSILDSSVLRVDATSRHLLPEEVMPVQLGQHTNFEPAPPGLLVEHDLTKLHPVIQKEQREVMEALRTYRPRPRLLAATKKAKEKRGGHGRKTPTGAPPPPQNMRRLAVSAPPPRKYSR